MKYSEYAEKKRHGSPDFPIQYYYVDQSHPQYRMPAHWHKEFEIIKVLKGEFNVFLNNVKYTLKADDILLVECGFLHRGEPNNSIYECVVFDLNMLKSRQNGVTDKFITPIINSAVGINRVLNRKNSELYIALSALFECLKEENTYYKLEVYSLLFKIFFELYNRGNITPIIKTSHSHQVKNILRLIEWIETNFSEHITLDKLSEISGFNKKYLCRVFKEYTSKTVIEYITDLRIENACFEISKNNKSVTEAAFDSGFNDLSYFCKVFKCKKGITPKEYLANENFGGIHS